jgi:hypothetical protein
MAILYHLLVLYESVHCKTHILQCSHLSLGFWSRNVVTKVGISTRAGIRTLATMTELPWLPHSILQASEPANGLPQRTVFESSYIDLMNMAQSLMCQWKATSAVLATALSCSYLVVGVTRKLGGKGMNCVLVRHFEKTSPACRQYSLSLQALPVTALSLLIASVRSREKTPWHESASELYRPRDRRLWGKSVPTFADRRCHVVSVTDPQGCILDFLNRSRYCVFQVAPQLCSRG